MNRLPEESEAGPSRINEEGIQLPPLNLTLTITPEFIRSIDSMIICPHQPLNLTHYTTPQQNLTPEKQKAKPKAAMHFPISEITIGQWTHKSRYQDDFKAKIYFKKRRLIWEILDDVQIETQVSWLKRKIEIQWSDILSFRTTCNPSAQRETLDVELKNRPTFFMETNPQADMHSQWKEIEDFTLNQSASKLRRHTLNFLPGDLQPNLEQLVSGDNFWSGLAEKRFPTLRQCIYFGVGDGDSNNNNSINLSSYNVNNDIPNSYPRDNHQTVSMNQIRGKQVTHQSSQLIYGGMNSTVSYFNIPTIYEVGETSHTRELSGRPNALDQDNHQIETMSQLPEPQVTHPSSQLNNEGMNITVPTFSQDYGDKNNNDSINLSSYNVNNDIPDYYPRDWIMALQFNANEGREMIPTVQDEGETSHTGELRGRQNSLDQDNQKIETMSQLPGPQVTHSSSQLNNEGMNITVPPLNIPMIQDEGETSNTGELRGSQSFAQDTQPNPNGLDDWLCLDGWPQNMDDINLDDINMDDINLDDINLDDDWC